MRSGLPSVKATPFAGDYGLPKSKNAAWRGVPPHHHEDWIWEREGFNRPLKHNGAAHLIKNNRFCLLGILETKLTTSAIAKIINRTFPGWCQTNNFDVIEGGRILIIWNPSVIDLVPEDISPQKEYVGETFGIGAAYEHAVADSWRFELCEIADRKTAWSYTDLVRAKRFCRLLSRSDLMMPPQQDATLLGTPTVIAISCGPKPFRFFNMWADHRDFMATVENGWNLNVEGTTQFCLCRKLKALKGHLKAFNNLHFSHISVRAKEADLALQDAQIQLESDPENATIRDSVRELKKKAVFLAEAERHFYYQKAKLHFLKMGDRNAKFFHDMVKRNAAKSSILAITKTDGTTVTSAMEIGQEFVSYFTSLLGTEVPTLPVDNDVFNWGPKLSSELALELCRVVTPEEVKQAIFHISDNKSTRTGRIFSMLLQTSMAYCGRSSLHGRAGFL
ncbi:hypothetical protein Sango_2877800 [Sesamum angolense]|uniref:Uncharacterized protein n=1 Tax=Sesamum angolense TaxID=2727404 RepID=A0AAE1W0C4_9LAMI|nr:hypothetical protein Sango_2877800 [Sesamum angolense]